MSFCTEKDVLTALADGSTIGNNLVYTLLNNSINKINNILLKQKRNVLTGLANSSVTENNLVYTLFSLTK